MKRVRAIVILTSVASSLVLGEAVARSAGQKTTQSSSVERELIALDEEWNDAEVRRDIAVLDRIMADEFVSTSNRGAIEPKRAVLDVFRSGDVTVESITCEDYYVRVYGNTAVMTHRATLKGRYKDQDISDTYRTTHVWVRRAGRWQVVVSQVTSVAER